MRPDDLRGFFAAAFGFAVLATWSPQCEFTTSPQSEGKEAVAQYACAAPATRHAGVSAAAAPWQCRRQLQAAAGAYAGI
jgi:hypothetical protein